MFLLIATIFIAEIIIVWTIISHIVKTDKLIKALQKDIISVKPQLKNILCGTRNNVKVIKEHKDKLFEIIEKKRNRILISSVISGIIYLTIFVVKRKNRKIAKIFQSLLVAKELWESFSS